MNQILLLVQTASHETGLSEAFLGVLPFALLIGLAIIYSAKQAKRQKEYMARAMLHMETLEKKTDRMIELLEETSKGNRTIQIFL